MKKIYLASSIETTGPHIGADITKTPQKLKLAFITTAAEGEKGDKQWLADDRQGLKKVGFNLFDYTITGKTPKQIRADLANADVIHVNGGDTFYLLLQARKTGFDTWIAQAVATGKIYTGSSAGSIVASPNISIVQNLETKTYQDRLDNFKGFALTDIIALPHWGSDHFKDRYLHQRLDVAYKPQNKIVLLNDWQYLRITDDTVNFIDIRDNKKSAP